MLRATAGRSLLLSASVLLLWSTLSTATPVGEKLMQRIKGLKYDPSMDAYVQNLPHYEGMPIMSYGEDPRVRVYALKGWDATINTNPYDTSNIHRIRPSRIEALDNPHVVIVNNILLKVENEQGGIAAKALKYGRPFKGSLLRKKPVEWDQVYDSATRFEVPSDQKAWLRDPVWHKIRSTLQKQRHVVFVDEAQHRLLAFRLNDGKVEQDVRDIVEHLHKRSIVSSDKAKSDDTFKTELTKRMDAEGEFNRRKDRTLNLGMRELNTFLAQAPLFPFHGEQKERYYPRIIYFDKYPVLPTDGVKESVLTHALHDHDWVWLVSRDHQAPHRIISAFKINKLKQHDTTRHHEAMQYLNSVDEHRGDFGDTITEVRYGSPYSKRKRNYKLQSWETIAEGTEFNLANAEPFNLRPHLEYTGHLRMFDPSTGKTWGLRLLKKGGSELQDITSLARTRF